MVPDSTSRKSTLRASQASLSVRKRAARARAGRVSESDHRQEAALTSAQPLNAPADPLDGSEPSSEQEEDYNVHETPPQNPQEGSPSPSQPLMAVQRVDATLRAEEAPEGLRVDPVVASTWVAQADPETQTVTLQLQDEDLSPISVIRLDADTWNQMADTFKEQLNPGYDPETIKQASTYRLRVPESTGGVTPEPLLTLIHADGTVLAALPITDAVVNHLGKVFDRLRPRKDRFNFKKEMLERPKRTMFFTSAFILLVVLPVGWGLVTYFTTLFTA